jgi:hypothetical protein
VIESILANLMGKNHKESFSLSSIKIKNGSVYEEIKDNGNIDIFANAHLLLRGITKESTMKSLETETQNESNQKFQLIQHQLQDQININIENKQFQDEVLMKFN